MKEQEIKAIIKTGVKSPSSDFTAKVMQEISSLDQQTFKENKWFLRAVVYVCCGIFALSIFVNIPEIQLFNFSIRFSPVIIPSLSLMTVFFVIYQYDEVRNLIRLNEKSKRQV